MSGEMSDGRGAIYGALIGAAIAVIIAAGGFLYQSGQINGHLETLEERELRIEDKVDKIYDQQVELRERTVRIEEHLNGSFRSAKAHGPR